MQPLAMFHHDQKEDYLYVRYEGRYELARLQTLVKESAEYCRTHALNRLLVDLREMEGKVSILDRFELGLLAVQELRGTVRKAALVYRPQEVNKFAENVARNRGGNMRAFGDMDAALEWLRDTG